MDFKLTDKEKKFLLATARKSIKFFFDNEKPLIPEEKELLSKKLKEKLACFVTIEKDKMLRGCIGNIEPRKPLFECIALNAVNAAFFDPRFMPLMRSELGKIEIEISVLSKAKKARVEEIKEGKHGVILQQGNYSATFLPQVWEQLPEKETFLSHLSEKAGLSSNAWKQEKTKFFVYEVIAFKESDFKKEKKWK